MQSAETQRIIARIYALTLAPHDLDRAVGELEADLVQVLRSVTGFDNVSGLLPDLHDPRLNPDALSYLRQHIEMAFSIQSEMKWDKASDDVLGRLVDLVPTAGFAIDEDGQILRMNAIARRVSGPATKQLAHIFGPDMAALILRTAGGLESQPDFATLPLASPNHGTGANSLLIKRLGHDGSLNGAGNGRFLLTVADFKFGAEVGVSVRQAFGLTAAEAQIALLIARGLSADAIATARGVSVQTIRTQIKSLKAKTKAQNLPDLVRLVYGFAAGLLGPASSQASDYAAFVQQVGGELQQIQTSEGRVVEYSVQGDPSGRPVMIFHNLPYGSLISEKAAAEAAKAGLRLIAPWRPGQGGTDTAPDLDRTRESRLDLAARDAVAVLDHLQIQRVQVLGNVGGTLFATWFAQEHPSRVFDMVFVSFAPSWQGRMLRVLTPRHRVLTLLSRYLPSAARLLVRSMVDTIKSKGMQGDLLEVAKGSPADLAFASDMDSVALIDQAVAYGLQYGVEPYCAEWRLLDYDLTQNARAMGLPIQILHGAQDRLLPRDFADRFVKEVPTANLRMLPDAGHFLFYTHWADVQTALIAGAETGRRLP